MHEIAGFRAGVGRVHEHAFGDARPVPSVRVGLLDEEAAEAVGAAERSSDDRFDRRRLPSQRRRAAGAAKVGNRHGCAAAAGADRRRGHSRPGRGAASAARAMNGATASGTSRRDMGRSTGRKSDGSGRHLDGKMSGSGRNGRPAIADRPTRQAARRLLRFCIGRRIPIAQRTPPRPVPTGEIHVLHAVDCRADRPARRTHARRRSGVVCADGRFRRDAEGARRAARRRGRWSARSAARACRCATARRA